MAEEHRLLNHRLLKHKRVVFVTTRYVRATGQSPLLSLFLFFLHFDNFAAFVKSAVGTDRMRKAHRTAVRAGGEVAGLQGIERAAVIAAALRVFALWMWGH